MAANLQDLAVRVQTDDAFKAEIKADPEAVLAKEAAAAYRTDPKFYRIAIVGLVLIIVLVIVSAIVVQIWKGENLSDWISALATTALGGLVGLFAPSPKGE